MCHDKLGCWKKNSSCWAKVTSLSCQCSDYWVITTNHLNCQWHYCCKKPVTRWRSWENLLSQTLGVGRPVSSPCHRTSAYHSPGLYMRGACRKKEEEGEGRNEREKEIHLSACLIVDHTITAHTCPFLTEVPVIISCSSGLNTQSVLERRQTNLEETTATWKWCSVLVTILQMF